MRFVWVFNGGGRFPSGVFSARERAETWIAQNRLSGILTLYPLDMGTFEWAVAEGHFVVKRGEQSTPEYIAKFSDGHEHYPYENGMRG